MTKMKKTMVGVLMMAAWLLPSMAFADSYSSLWKQWERHGDKDALEILTEYNRADTINLERIADIIYGRLVKEHAGFKW